MKRSFDRGGNHERPSYVVACGKCGCGSSFNVGTHGGSMAPEVVARSFRREGWSIGKRSQDDICPGCSLKASQRAPLPILVASPTPADLPNTTASQEPAVNAPTKPSQTAIGAAVQTARLNGGAVPPRPMSRDERRIISSKLHDVYLDERRGYSGNWTDKLLADDLGVPFAWVAEVREQFGPDLNERTSAVLSEVRAAVKTCEASVGRVAKIHGDMVADFAVLREKLASFEGRV